MTDVLIVGGGLAGWRAAEAAADAGASVTLVANGDGNSPHIHALNCPVLSGDSAERMFADTMASGHGTNDPKLVRVLCEGAVKLKDEFDFDRDASGAYLTIQPLGSSVPRCVSINHAIGAWELRRIKAKLKGKIEIVNGRVTEIRREGCGFEISIGGEILRHGGARAAVVSTVRHARAVVLATGGWCGKYDFSTNPPYLCGDGIALAESLGAATRDMDAVQYEPTVRVEGPKRGVPVITTLLYKGATLRNMQGEEFVQDVRVNKDELSKKILEEIEGEVCGKGDLALARENTDRAKTLCPQGVVHETRASPPLQAVIYDLTDVAADDLLACKMDPAERRILVAPAAHTSLGGVVIDTESRVMRTDGSPIEGLFAAGEVTGGLHGRNRLGGNAGTEVMVFGRIAGANAAKHARIPTIFERAGGRKPAPFPHAG